MKILALDIGDRWTGTALSDPLGMFATPYKTIQTDLLKSFIQELVEQENIRAIVVGYPQTLRGTESEQTRKVKKIAKDLEQSFPEKEWILWDERLTSKQAEKFKKAKKNQKGLTHAIAAALILTGYLEYSYLKRTVK